MIIVTKIIKCILRELEEEVMKMLFKIVGAILIVFVIFIGAMGYYITRGLESGKELVIGDVDVSVLSDGSYVGKNEAGRFSNEVKVIIEDHKIIQIDILDDIRFNKPEVTSKIISKVLEEQNANVDVVSGATVSSKAYLKAIENALEK